MASVAFILAYIELDLITVSFTLFRMRNNSICSQINISDTK